MARSSRVVKKGVAPDFFMQPFDGRIRDTEIWNMVNYIKSLSREEVRTAAIVEPHEPAPPPHGGRTKGKRAGGHRRARARRRHRRDGGGVLADACGRDGRKRRRPPPAAAGRCRRRTH